MSVDSPPAQVRPDATTPPMTATPASATTPATATTFAAVTTPRSAWQRLRLPLALLAALLVGATAIAFLTGSSSGDDLDPTSYTQGGARAVATLLAERGSPVTRLDDVPRDDPATLVIPDSGLLNERALRAALAVAGDHPVVIVVTDDGPSDDALGVDSSDADLDDPSYEHDPGCGFGPAVTADQAETGTRTFGLRTLPPGFTVDGDCYDGTLLALRGRGGGELVLLGANGFLTNARLDKTGNAALALSLLDHGGPVAWVQPHPGTSGAADGDDGGSSVVDLLPHRLKVAAWELLVVALLIAAWRARRLGPIVEERLPVVVRSAETVRGRARLYRGSGARDRAALALREGARAALATRLGLGPQTTPDALVTAVAAATGRRQSDVGSLLYGAGASPGAPAAPPDDDALVRLAADLDTLTKEARR